MSSLYELVASPPFPEDSFMAYTQNAEQIPGGGPVKPDVGMEFIRYRDDRRNLLRIEAKTILVQLKHAPDLQDLVGLYRNDAAWEKKKTAEGILTQVRFPA
jgi:hypothetical protein